MEELFRQALLIIFAAAVGEAVIEFIPAPLVDLALPKFEPDEVEEKVRKVREKVRTVIFNLLSAILGVGIAFTFGSRLFEMLGAVRNFVGVDEVLTGIMIGRGSNFVHGLLKRFFLTITDKLERIQLRRETSF